MELLKKVFNGDIKEAFEEFFEEKSGDFVVLDEELEEYEDETFQEVEKLGEIEELKLGVFLIKLEKIEETSSKKKQFEFAKKLLKELDYEAGIFVFYDEEYNFRFSFVFKEYIGTKEKYSPFKRYTYFVSKDKTNKTFKIQLSKADFSSIESIKEAFSISEVTKEFYKGLEKLYFELLEDIIYPSSNENAKKEFVIKLIGRLVFLKFLEKKGLIESNVFEVKENYYFEVLEPLFFEQLNKPNNERFEKFKNAKIPFLNGGLFEPIKDIDYYEFDKDLEERKPIPLKELKIKDEFFKNLFEHFNEFNFTVDENSLDDNELSIDPEMLGRIFENFIAEINPETSKNARKATGSYYTPREIVDYMVSESLLEYLKVNTKIEYEKLKKLIYEEVDLETYEKTDILTALFKVKILDPACGSGAFPMGILQKILKILKSIDEDGSIWFNLQNDKFRKKYKDKDIDYFRKLSIINNSIYGVDIQPIAIEIAKLRFFLSLIVEEKIDDSKENRGIEPLPNLEFKFVCANTLIPLKQKDSSLRTDNYYKYLKELKELKNKYFLSFGEEKEEIKKEYRKIQNKLFEEVSLHNLGEAITDNLVNYDPFNPLSVAEFFDSEFMFNVTDGFDIVIGNPPYIRIQSIDSVFSEKYKTIYNSATGKYDIYVLFVERGLNLLNENGILNFIMPHKWINSGFGKGLRKFSKEYLCKFISFRDYQVFAASTYTSLVWFCKNRTSNILKYIELDDNLTTYNLEKWLLSIKEQDFTKIETYELDENPWVFKDKITYEILQKLKTLPFTLSDFFIGIYQGIVTGDNDVFYIYDVKINDNYIEGYSKAIDDFVILERDIVKPLLSGNDIKKYCLRFNNTYLIYPYYLNNNDKTVLISESLLKEKYSLTYNYLKKIKKRLLNRGSKNMIYPSWYSLWNYRQIKNQNAIKILTPDICYGTSMSLDERGDFFYNDTAYALIKKDNVRFSYKFLLAILNSNLCWFYLKNTSSVLRGGYFRFKTNYLKFFPFPKIDLNNTKPFEILVDYIIFLKQQNQNILQTYPNNYIVDKIQELLDAMVYELYFEKELHSKNYFFIDFANKNFKELQKEKEKEIIKNSFDYLINSKSELKNKLGFLAMDFKELILPIKGKY